MQPFLNKCAKLWDNAAQFLLRINTALGFPDAWRFIGPCGTGDYRMECRGLNLGFEFNSGLAPALTFNDAEAPKIIVRRMEEKEERRRRAEAEREKSAGARKKSAAKSLSRNIQNVDSILALTFEG